MVLYFVADRGDAHYLPAVIDIYESSIKAAERKPSKDIARAYGGGSSVFVLAREGAQALGFSMLTPLEPAGQVWLMEYMAVAASCRSQGVGQNIFRLAMDEIERRGSPATCLLEVNVPIPGQSTYVLDAARFRFYASLGCARLDGLHYDLPLDAAPPPMCLLEHGWAAGTAIPKSALAAWLSEIYGEIYGGRRDDPRIARMLSPLAEDIALVPVVVAPA